MAHPTDIGIFFIAKSTVDLEESRKWLDYIGADKFEVNTNSKTDSEALIELAGRRCYNSFQSGLNPNVTKIRTNLAEYIENILKSGHGSVLEHATYSFAIEGVSRVFTSEMNRHRAGWAMCLSGDTLIYSERNSANKNGTKKRTIREIFKKTQTSHGRSRLKLMKLRVLNESTGRFEVGKIKNVINSGIKPVYLVELENGYNIKLTRNHKIFTNKGWMTLENIVDNKLFVNNTGLTIYGNPIAQIATNGRGAPPNAMHLLNEEIAYRNKNWLEEEIRNGMSYIKIAKKANVSRHTIRSWVKKLGLLGFSRKIGLSMKNPWNKGLRYKGKAMTDEQYAHHMKVVRRGENHPMWRGGITPHPMERNLRNSILSRDNYTCKMCNKSPHHNKLHIHHINVYEIGKSSNIDPLNLITLCISCHGKVTGRESSYSKQLYELIGSNYIKSAQSSPKIGSPLHVIFKNIINITYIGEEDTYDIEMIGPNHNFIGNGFIIHNSEGSMRYIRFEDMEYWLPLSIHPCSSSEICDSSDQISEEIITKRHIEYKKLKSRMIFDSAFKDAEKHYQELLDVWKDELSPESKFHLKKEITSMMRRIVPMGVATGGIWTGNIRAIRHVITTRTTEAAEEEICYVFSNIMKKIAEIEPNLFGDFKQDENGFWHPLYRA